MRLGYGLPSQEEAWMTFAAEVGGAFHRHGGSTHKVVAQVEGREIVLGTVFLHASGDHTRVRAGYLSRGNFSFTVRKRSLFTPIAELLGAQDIEIWDPSFDRWFRVKSNDSTRVRSGLGLGFEGQGSGITHRATAPSARTVVAP